MLVGFPPPPSAQILESLQTIWSFTTVYHLPLSYALSALAALHLNYFCLAATYLHISALRWDYITVASPRTVCSRSDRYVCECLRRCVDWILLLQDGLPLPQPLSYWEASDHAMNLGPPFTHIVLDVEDKRLLAKVSVYDLAWSLKPHSGVQVGLEDIRSKTIQVKTDSFCIVHSILSISKLNQKVELNRVVF